MAAGGSISSLLETWRRADEGFSAPRSPPAASAGASSGRRRTLFAESRQAEAEPLAAGDTALHSLRLQIGRLLSDAKQREVEMETLRTRLSSEAERDASQEVDRLHHEAAGVRRALQRRTRARAYCRAEDVSHEEEEASTAVTNAPRLSPAELAVALAAANEFDPPSRPPPKKMLPKLQPVAAASRKRLQPGLAEEEEEEAAATLQSETEAAERRAAARWQPLVAMHPQLTLDNNQMCVDQILAFQRCHEEVGLWGKLTARCNTEKSLLDRRARPCR
ncbi:hypothetical protein EMIHUDRAFT_241201 [Emiliania huxleyi CCMP1516]|uniref:Uncharacterized protein n=2 Tax=Emiliania huxleyi TaxID=2903 RepID=A0A0D3JD55_EMIH1|nr:hypothetical protein EMIHUDRAFT_241201 [Emiliania huxleyi CCMP1516]EOD21440.1 hypothetical protein EMIHUDRAFT_241201 [Emiliania huxleyi CCMP1516]|eukprot:XP_005773869.1 hypothetical protein EMIHUDRAFT_241201 [Emiliania huxleyi CCMP1516]